MTYVDVGTDGPLVIEVPPGQQGILDDFWQRPISGPTVEGKTYAGDVGLPGPDKGKGGKFLLLPPGYREDTLEATSLISRTNDVFVFWRAFFNDPANLDPPNKLIAQTRIYPLRKEAETKPMQFAIFGRPRQYGFPTDSSFFDMGPVHRSRSGGLRMPTGEACCRDRPSNRSFKPDERTVTILNAAVQDSIQMCSCLIYSDSLQTGGLI